MAEPQFVALMRQQIAGQQLLGAVIAGVTAPPTLTNAVFAFQEEQRSALMAEVSVCRATRAAATNGRGTDAVVSKPSDQLPGAGVSSHQGGGPDAGDAGEDAHRVGR